MRLTVGVLAISFLGIGISPAYSQGPAQEKPVQKQVSLEDFVADALKNLSSWVVDNEASPIATLQAALSEDLNYGDVFVPKGKQVPVRYGTAKVLYDKKGKEVTRRVILVALSSTQKEVSLGQVEDTKGTLAFFLQRPHKPLLVGDNAGVELTISVTGGVPKVTAVKVVIYRDEKVVSEETFAY